MYKFKKIQYDPIYIETNVQGAILNMKSKRKKMFNLSDESKQISALVDHLPNKNEIYKMISTGGFSTLGIINYIASKERIERLYVSTFRIGQKHFNRLIELHKQNKLEKCYFITSSTQKRIDQTAKYKDREYNYFEYMIEKAKQFEWEIKIYDNHSKLVLIKTLQNYYVIETSSNLNECPKMEHFSWENDKKLYLWYESWFEELFEL